MIFQSIIRVAFCATPKEGVNTLGQIATESRFIQRCKYRLHLHGFAWYYWHIVIFATPFRAIAM
jgi:hypothetical protein